MPGRDGTGPLGHGPMSGRGFGVCNGANAVDGRSGLGQGQGFGLGHGGRRGSGDFTTDPSASKTQKELLEEQKKLLESRLDIISKQLESL